VQVKTMMKKSAGWLRIPLVLKEKADKREVLFL
jgi:hypothetical protein